MEINSMEDLDAALEQEGLDTLDEASESPVEAKAEEVPQEAAPEAVEPVAEPVGPVEGAELAEGVEQPAWEPNYKYRAFRQEHEIPEEFRALIKDADSQDLVSRLLSKGHGFEQVKEDRNQLKEQYSGLESQYSEVQKDLNLAANYVQKGDGHSFIEFLQGTFPNIEQTMLQWAYDKAMASELSEHEKMSYNQRHEARRRANQAELQAEAKDAQSSHYEQQIHQLRQEQHEFQLSQLLAQPDAQSFQQRFTEKMGHGVDFKDEMKKVGSFLFHTTQKDPSPQEVLQEMMRMHGYASGQPAQATPPNQPQQPQQTAVAHNQSLPVIPNVGGAGTASPVQKKISSLDALEKAYEEAL